MGTDHSGCEFRYFGRITIWGITIAGLVSVRPCVAVAYTAVLNRSDTMTQRCRFLLSLRFYYTPKVIPHPAIRLPKPLGNSLTPAIRWWLKTGPECCKPLLRHATTKIMLLHLTHDGRSKSSYTLMQHFVHLMACFKIISVILVFNSI